MQMRVIRCSFLSSWKEQKPNMLFPCFGEHFCRLAFLLSFEYLEQNTPRVVNDFKDTGSTVRQVIKMYTACVG